MSGSAISSPNFQICFCFDSGMNLNYTFLQGMQFQHYFFLQKNNNRYVKCRGIFYLNFGTHNFSYIFLNITFEYWSSYAIDLNTHINGFITFLGFSSPCVYTDNPLISFGTFYSYRILSLSPAPAPEGLPFSLSGWLASASTSLIVVCQGNPGIWQSDLVNVGSWRFCPQQVGGCWCCPLLQLVRLPDEFDLIRQYLEFWKTISLHSEWL